MSLQFALFIIAAAWAGSVGIGLLGSYLRRQQWPRSFDPDLDSTHD